MKKEVKVSLIAVGSVVVLVLAWYLASPLFVNKQVNEESPVVSNPQNEVLMGSFVDADNFHKVSGTAKIIKTENSAILRLEDFKATNGPDLKVYLSNDLEANDYVNLGSLKGNIGDQNYDLTNVNYKDYDYVLIWCKAFSVLFGYSKIE